MITRGHTMNDQFHLVHIGLDLPYNWAPNTCTGQVRGHSQEEGESAYLIHYQLFPNRIHYQLFPGRPLDGPSLRFKSKLGEIKDKLQLDGTETVSDKLLDGTETVSDALQTRKQMPHTAVDYFDVVLSLRAPCHNQAI